MKPLFTSSMKEAVYGSAAKIGKANAMASEDSALMIRSLWKPWERNSAERKPDNMPCTVEGSSSSTVPETPIRNARLSMACLRLAQRGFFHAGFLLSPVLQFESRRGGVQCGHAIYFLGKIIVHFNTGSI